MVVGDEPLLTVLRQPSNPSRDSSDDDQELKMSAAVADFQTAREQRIRKIYFIRRYLKAIVVSLLNSLSISKGVDFHSSLCLIQKMNTWKLQEAGYLSMKAAKTISYRVSQAISDGGPLLTFADFEEVFTFGPIVATLVSY